MRRAPEKQIEADIIKALRTLGFVVSKTSQPRASMMTPGIPDLYAAHPRWRIRVWIEVKAPKGRTSPAQDAWHAAEREAGGTVLVVRSVRELIAELQKIGAPITVALAAEERADAQDAERDGEGRGTPPAQLPADERRADAPAASRGRGRSAADRSALDGRANRAS